MKLGRKHASILLAAILLVFVLNCRTFISDLLVGVAHDEMLYFEAARSLSENGTYRVLSLPGEPAQTKYPVLFSMLLSVVWLTGPDFPENLIWAQTLMVFFGVLLLLATYNFARSLQCSRAGAIAITAIFSIHPSTITLSTILLRWFSRGFFSAVWSALIATCREQRRILPGPNSWCGCCCRSSQ